MAKVEPRGRRAAHACAERDAEAGEQAGQYGGFDAERDVGPPSGPARAAREVEGRRQRAMSVSSETSRYPRPRPGNLREIAAKIEAATGLRVQIVGGRLVMSPTPRGKHAGVVKRCDKADWYAVAGVAVLLVLDPRKGTWALHTRPDNGAYQDVMPGKFGEPVRLPEPIGIEIAAGGFPVYGASSPGTQPEEGSFTERSK